MKKILLTALSVIAMSAFADVSGSMPVPEIPNTLGAIHQESPLASPHSGQINLEQIEAMIVVGSNHYFMGQLIKNREEEDAFFKLNTLFLASESVNETARVFAHANIAYYNQCFNKKLVKSNLKSLNTLIDAGKDIKNKSRVKDTFKKIITQRSC